MRVQTVVRADTVGLFLLAAGPWLAWLPRNFLGGLAAPKFRPLPLKFGRYRYRAGFIARRSAEDLAPFGCRKRPCTISPWSGAADPPTRAFGDRLLFVVFMLDFANLGGPIR